MLAHLLAVKAALEALPSARDVYVIDAVRYDEQGNEVPLRYPYYLVWPSAGAPGSDEALCGTNEHASFLVGVTSVGLVPDQALVLARNAKSALGATKPVPLTVAGRAATIRWDRFGQADVDRDVTVPATGRHPAFSGDLFRVESTPTT